MYFVVELASVSELLLFAMSRTSENPESGGAVMPAYVNEWDRSGACRVYTTTRPLSFLSCVAVYYTGQPESIFCLYDQVERMAACFNCLYPSDDVTLSDLNSGEPSVDQMSVLAQILDVQFEVFVGNGVYVRQDPAIIGPHIAGRISLICYPVAGESHFGLIFAEEYSGPRMTSLQFSNFLGRVFTALDVGRCGCDRVVWHS